MGGTPARRDHRSLMCPGDGSRVARQLRLVPCRRSPCRGRPAFPAGGRRHYDVRSRYRLPIYGVSVDGYPIDERGSRAAHGQSLTGLLPDFEWSAARVVARLTGEMVVLQDDNTEPGMVDVRIDHANGRPAFVEVWTDVEEGYAQMSAEVSKGSQILAPGLTRFWFVTVSGAYDVERGREMLPRVLAALEATGDTFPVMADEWHLRQSGNRYVAELLELGASEVVSRPLSNNEQGAVHLTAEGMRGPADVGWEPFLDWVQEKLASPGLGDVRSKLAKTGAEDRHLFVGITYTSPWAVFFGLHSERRDIPQAPPALPKEITHLWLMHAQSSGRCLAWFPDRGWFDTRWHWATA
jgi:hypothetical protein